MMKVRFNKFERISGVFVGMAIIGSIAVTVITAIKKNWFTTKVIYNTVFHNASGIHAGTPVQMSGLRAGEVDEVDLRDDNSIVVKFYMLDKFAYRVRSDSKVMVTRPFIIGEKVLDVLVGSQEALPLASGSEIKSEESIDVMDILNGRKLAPYLELVQHLIENLKVVGEAFLDPERSKTFIKVFDELHPVLVNVNKMSRAMVDMSDQMTHKKYLQKVMKNLGLLTKEINDSMPDIKRLAPLMAKDATSLIGNLKEFTDEFKDPQFISDFTQMVKNFSLISAELKKIVPAISAVSGELPRAGLRAIEALDEAVVLLKAMQKSFVLRGSVEEVKEEEKNNKDKELRKMEPIKIERVPSGEENSK